MSLDATEPAGLSSAQEVRALRQHPQFPAALRFLAAGLVDIYDGNRLLNPVLNDRGRLVLSFMVFYLHFSAAFHFAFMTPPLLPALR
jgi:hypothetical protein